MFGHVKGAFTGAVSNRKGSFELADGGTIFLDEIGELGMAEQVKMLRVLQEHTFQALGDSRSRKTDIRVVCATSADLPKMVVEGRSVDSLPGIEPVYQWLCRGSENGGAQVAGCRSTG